MIIFVSPKGIRGVSSVGSERMLDRHEVTGSIPVRPTLKASGFPGAFFCSVGLVPRPRDRLVPRPDAA